MTRNTVHFFLHVLQYVFLLFHDIDRHSGLGTLRFRLIQPAAADCGRRGALRLLPLLPPPPPPCTLSARGPPLIPRLPGPAEAGLCCGIFRGIAELGRSCGCTESLTMRLRPPVTNIISLAACISLACCTGSILKARYLLVFSPRLLCPRYGMILEVLLPKLDIGPGLLRVRGAADCGLGDRLCCTADAFAQSTKEPVAAVSGTGTDTLSIDRCAREAAGEPGAAEAGRRGK